MPKQILQTFHSYQQNAHRCTRQETLHFSSKESTKTSDTTVFYRGNFYEVDGVFESTLNLKKIRTVELNTDEIVRLPWCLVGVAKLIGVKESAVQTVDKSVIQAKGVIVQETVSTLYPQWVIT